MKEDFISVQNFYNLLKFMKIINKKIVNMRFLLKIIISIVLLCLSESKLAYAEDKLLSLSLEELMEVKVTSVSKREHKATDSAAAIYVITSSDIERSSATNIPELLRMVPGIHVAQVNANNWAITSRGNNGIFANKLLVLVDGRSVYTPIFAGVFWPQLDLVLEDIERIEVIRGPGATLWGANAVNGVINIITKKAKATQGNLISAAGGSEIHGLASVRHGSTIGENTDYRVYGKFKNIASSETTLGEDSFDHWKHGQVGFRADSQLGDNDTLTIQGDSFAGKARSYLTTPSLLAPYKNNVMESGELYGQNILAKWSHQISKGSDLSLQTYFDRADRDDIILKNEINTFDTELQHRFSPFENDSMTWGLGYRSYHFDLDQTMPLLSFTPHDGTVDQASGFLQNEYSLFDGELKLIAGSKFENNDFTGFEAQPSARAIWTVNQENTIWTSFSRALRTPTLVQEYSSFQASVFPDQASNLPTLVSTRGNHDNQSERLYAYELGYRRFITSKAHLDIATFYNHYEEIEDFRAGNPSLVSGEIPYILVPVHYSNGSQLESTGIESVLDYELAKGYRFQFSHTYLYLNHQASRDSIAIAGTNAETESASNLANIRSMIDLPYDLELDSMLRYVDSVPGLNIDSYFELDMRLGWNFSKELELSLIGQNLLQSNHAEYVSNAVAIKPSELQRAVYGKIVWRF
jgi:iron complex outermembrane recepter protein